MRDHEGKPTDGRGLREKLTTDRIDFGKPGDPSGCYMPREWWRPPSTPAEPSYEAAQTARPGPGCNTPSYGEKE